MDNHYLFSYESFFNDMKNGDERPDYCETASKYEETFGCQDGLTIQDQSFYKDYLSQFKDEDVPFQFLYPEELEGDFDWSLLYKFIFGSLSSAYSFVLDEDWKDNPEGIPLVHIVITVHSGGQEVTKTLDELWSFQILRLYEIYANEQMDLAILREEGEDEKEGMERERDQRLISYKKKVSALLKEVKSRLILKRLLSTI